MEEFCTVMFVAGLENIMKISVIIIITTDTLGRINCVMNFRTPLSVSLSPTWLVLRVRKKGVT
jgi:hypothetical protein